MSPPRRWTDEELALAKVLFCDRMWTTKRVAKRFGLTFSATDGRLKRAGLRNGRYQKRNIDALVKRYHVRGLNDNETAAKISEILDHDIFGRAVKRSRERQGLSSNYDPVKHREKLKVAAKTAAVSGPQVRYDREREVSARLGWPPVTARSRRVFLLLEAEGELDTETASGRLGLRFRRPAKWCSAYRLMAKLKHGGWVVSKCAGTSRKVWWRLSEGVIEQRRRYLIENRSTNEDDLK